MCYCISDLENLVEYLQISDDSITASSVYDSAIHAAYRVRTDNYFDQPCCWSAGKGDAKPWVQFDLGVEVTVWGVLIKPRCDAGYQVVCHTNLIISLKRLWVYSAMPSKMPSLKHKFW